MVDQLFEALKSEDMGLFRKLISTYVLRKADELLVGKQMIPVEDVNALDIIVSYPSASELVAQKVAEYGSADFQAVTWSDIKGSLDKYQVKVRVSDEAIKRRAAEVGVRRSIEAAANGIRRAEDNEIFAELLSYVGDTFATSGAWNGDTPKIGEDIAKAIESIYENTNEDSFRNFVVAIPSPVYPHLIRSVVEGTDTTVLDFMDEKFGIKLLPTKYLSTDALVVVNSEETAIHYRFTDEEAEEARVPGVGYDYIINAYFKTFVIPDEPSKNYRIVKITGVKA